MGTGIVWHWRVTLAGKPGHETIAAERRMTEPCLFREGLESADFTPVPTVTRRSLKKHPFAHLCGRLCFVLLVKSVCV